MTVTHDDLAKQLERLEATLRMHIADSADWRRATDRRIEENTSITSRIRDIATTGKTIRNLVIWLGGLAAGAVGVWQLWEVLNR